MRFMEFQQFFQWELANHITVKHEKQLFLIILDQKLFGQTDGAGYLN